MLRRGAIEVDRMVEIVEHSALLFKNVLMKIFTLPTQATLSPTLSLPLLIAEAINPKGVNVIPTPFTENVVHEMQELIKYFDPNYVAKTEKAARGNGSILIDAIRHILSNKENYCKRTGKQTQKCAPNGVVILNRPNYLLAGTQSFGPMGAQPTPTPQPASTPSIGPLERLFSGLRG